MIVTTVGNATSQAFLSAPWEPYTERRGDALGLRALADEFADAVTPGMSGQINDARWITILSWCLVHAHEVHTLAGDAPVNTRVQQRERYAWLRPLELLWIARTIRLSADFAKRPLPGRRGVKLWCDGSRRRAGYFGLTEEQFDRYRQSGIYGAYRVAFRKWPGLTLGGDGWTPGPEAHKLASWLDEKLGGSKPQWRVAHSDGVDGPGRRSVLAGSADKQSWWLRQWPTFDSRSHGFDATTLPRPRTQFSALAEHKLLNPIAFSEDPMGRRRRDITKSMSRSSAQDMVGLCDDLSKEYASHSVISRLADFARLLEAGLLLMDFIALVMEGDEPKQPLERIARHPEAKQICAQLFEVSKQWLRHENAALRHAAQARTFAEAIESERPVDCVASVLRHHEQHGSGKRWFVLRDGNVLLRTPQRALNGLNWFRLGALARIAVQVGELPAMPRAMTIDVETDDLIEDETSVE